MNAAESCNSFEMDRSSVCICGHISAEDAEVADKM
eukprot:COSAG04_NODE_17710_length_461_cov_0.848066_2_plen_34_part_01